MPELPDEAYAAALASMPLVAASRLHEMVDKFGWAQAWELARDDRLRHAIALRTTSERQPSEVFASWSDHLRQVDVDRYFDRHLQLGIEIILRDSPLMPLALADDAQPPAVLFCRGDRQWLSQTCVGVVGTRRASSYGVVMAKRIGAELAEIGIGVVSGLALGIDGAAHRGSLAGGRGASDIGHLAPAKGRPIGVVASGLDVVYPRQHADLWHAVIEDGVLISEVPVGGRPLTWRFAQRNRLIAALSHAVVCVESKKVGGSMTTARMAISRGLGVFAVPGVITNPLAHGPLDLLHEGANVYRNVDDIVIGLSSRAPWVPPLSTTKRHRSLVERVVEALDPVSEVVLECLETEPRSVDAVVEITGLSLVQVVAALDRMQSGRRVEEVFGQWVVNV